MAPVTLSYNVTNHIIAIVYFHVTVLVLALFIIRVIWMLRDFSDTLLNIFVISTKKGENGQLSSFGKRGESVLKAGMLGYD